MKKLADLNENNQTEWLCKANQKLGEVLDEMITERKSDEVSWMMDYVAEARQIIQAVINDIENRRP
ncbi:MAG: hypothetical protein K6G46_09380 [Prevotella sp.]|nr:hypothetical protein [Prevotella sp.]